jgi:hypothetical protein
MISKAVMRNNMLSYQLVMVVPGERIELPTNGLQNRCSTAELTRHRRAF